MLHPVAPEHGAPKGISGEEKKREASFEKFDKSQSNGSSEYLVTPANKGRRMEVGYSHVFGSPSKQDGVEKGGQGGRLTDGVSDDSDAVAHH
ncbi:UNVERIFIED_CONTAM: hypothetical protein Sradi_5801500 [Sesamum radiatum]|uniref:Uncharacterized protein n=1 Tax=Sesamum radiatum TaxID=300843 RepID=A0AAW2KQ07_SESRA